jgi:hypothetical protein
MFPLSDVSSIKLKRPSIRSTLQVGLTQDAEKEF